MNIKLNLIETRAIKRLDSARTELAQALRSSPLEWNRLDSLESAIHAEVKLLSRLPALIATSHPDRLPGFLPPGSDCARLNALLGRLVIWKGGLWQGEENGADKASIQQVYKLFLGGHETVAVNSAAGQQITACLSGTPAITLNGVITALNRVRT